MITVNSTLGENVIGFTIDGKINDEGLQEFFNAVDEKINENGKIKLLGEIKDIGGIEDFKSFFDAVKAKIKTISALEKYAIVGNMSWLEKISGVMDFMIPNIPIKVFKMEERDEALVWLLSESNLYAPGIQKIKTDKEDKFLAFSLSGKLHEQDFAVIEGEFTKFKEDGKPLNLYVEFAGFEGYSNIKAMWDDFKMGFKHYKDMKKIAIINEGEWMDVLVKLGDILTPGVDLEHFDTDQKERAINWLNA